ncbi:MAG: DNA repair protein RecO [Clostridium sp.]|jgi:DNA repair protein RecO (recombination protein O)|nr:DNA repair protein RecO [Clostridium sp.]
MNPNHFEAINTTISLEKSYMMEVLSITGMIIWQVPSGEYDRRVTIFCKERGKITALAKGARKPTGKLGAVSFPYCFGKFTLIPSRSFYIIKEAVIENYFEGLHQDYEGACYAAYFAEIACVCAQENNDEAEFLKLLYQTLRALLAENIPNRLVRVTYELKVLFLNGEIPHTLTPQDLSFAPPNHIEPLMRAYEHIFISKVQSLYTFSLSEEVRHDLERLTLSFVQIAWNYSFKSLAILKTLG